MSVSTTFDENDPHAFAPPQRSPLQRLFEMLGFGVLEDKPLTHTALRECYERPESFANFLPWVDYDAKRQVFGFQDGVSVGAVFEIQAADAEARPSASLLKMLSQMTKALSNVPERGVNPWIAQFYVQDEPLQAMGTVLRNYAEQVGAPASALLDDHLKLHEDHFRQMGTPGGVFTDKTAGVRWGGKYRRIRLCFYRRFDEQRWPNANDAMPGDELNRAMQSIIAGLNTVGIKAHRYGPAQMYQWMFAWFNPKPFGTIDSPWEFLLDYPVTNAGIIDAQTDLTTRVLRNMPHANKSRQDEGVWSFNGLPHCFLPIVSVNTIPPPGHVMLERTNARGQSASLFDRLPTGSVYYQSIVFTPKDKTKDALTTLHKRSNSDKPSARMTKEECDACFEHMSRGHALHPTTMGVYLRGSNTQHLGQCIDHSIALLQDFGLEAINPEHDLVRQDSYVHHLPMAYMPQHERKLLRSKRQWLSRTLACSGLWGNSTGSGKPGLVFSNRSGEPVLFDPFTDQEKGGDRVDSSHGLVLGPTGAGKSATLNYFCMQLMAMHLPYLYIVDVGDSYRLLGEYFKSKGLNVHYVNLDTANIALPPFVNAIKALEEQEAIERKSSSQVCALPDEGDKTGTAAPVREDEKRKYMEEMEAAARLIITGGDALEEKQYRRHDRTVVNKAILHAAARTRSDGRTQTMISDFVWALDQFAGGEPMPGTNAPLDEKRRSRVAEMRDAASIFLDGYRGEMFNREGAVWPEADVTIIDMGRVAMNEDYKDVTALAYIGLMDTIQSAAQARKDEDRQSYVLGDEAHVTTTNPMLADYLVKGSKMWRKWGLWLWLGTQNMKDFPDNTSKILNMMEWWICLKMPLNEIADIARFKSLSDEEKSLMSQTRKESGKYVEGVVLSQSMAPFLFRNVPPAFALALAQTNQRERAHRHFLMKEHNLTELEAVYMIAEEIKASRIQTDDPTSNDGSSANQSTAQGETAEEPSAEPIEQDDGADAQSDSATTNELT